MSDDTQPIAIETISLADVLKSEFNALRICTPGFVVATVPKDSNNIVFKAKGEPVATYAMRAGVTALGEQVIHEANRREQPATDAPLEEHRAYVISIADSLLRLGMIEPEGGGAAALVKVEALVAENAQLRAELARVREKLASVEHEWRIGRLYYGGGP